MYSIFAILLSVFISFPTYALTVTTLNLEWFGRGGDIAGSALDEHRQKTLYKFVTTELKRTDLFVFQEILDLPLLAAVFPGWDCRTYSPHDLEHQHVAACARPGLILRDTTIESVKLTPGLRPAYRIELAWHDGETLNVIGLHLKAGKENTEKRLQQIRNLLTEIETDGPTLILGDFNTFPKDRTGLAQDDSTYIKELFLPHGIEQVGGDQITYLGFGGRAFDLVWERDIDVKHHSVGGPCGPEKDKSQPFSNESYYLRLISDHCPVTVELEEARI